MNCLARIEQKRFLKVYPFRDYALYAQNMNRTIGTITYSVTRSDAISVMKRILSAVLMRIYETIYWASFIVSVDLKMRILRLIIRFDLVRYVELMNCKIFSEFAEILPDFFYECVKKAGLGTPGCC